MKLVYDIRVEADDQPGLVEALRRVVETWDRGSSYQNVSAFQFNLKLEPVAESVVEEMRRQWVLAHPKAAVWAKLERLTQVG